MERQCSQAPRPRLKEKVTVPKRHACYAKCRGVPGDQARPSAPPKRTTRAGSVPQAPRPPRKMKVDVAKCRACQAKRKGNVTKCHACHEQRRGAPSDQARPPVPSEPARCHKRHASHAKRRWMSASATPATDNEGGSATSGTQREGQCRQVPRLCHACHAKGRLMFPSATPATQRDG